MFKQKVKHRKKEKKISLEKARKKKLKQKEQDIFDKVPELIELIIPDCIDEKRDYTVLGENRYSRSFVISAYPNKTYLGWLDRIFNLLGDISLSIINRPANDDSVIRQLNKKVTILESERQTYESKGNIDLIHPLEKMIYDYDQIRRQVQTANDKLFFVTILLRINSTNLEELDAKSNLLKNEFAKISAKARTLNFRQLEGLKANLPFNELNIFDYERNVTSDGLATMFPIANSNTESSPNGVPIGRNYFTGLPVYLDTFDKNLTNPHVVILGITGAGKSVTMDTLSARSLVTKNTQSAILDIEGEYKKRTENLGGRVISIKQGIDAGINIFDIDVEQEENGMEKINILNKVAEIRAILSGIMKNYMDRPLNAKELVDIEESVIETYKSKGITTFKESLYEKEGGKIGNKLTLGKIKKEMPTLTDFQKILASKKNSKELAEILTGFLRGKSLGMFDCQSNININDICIDFDLSNITDEVTKFYSSLVITTWITEKYMRRSNLYEEKSIYIDEAWTMLKYEETANFIEQLARRARKRGVRLVLASQMAEEFTASPQGRASLNSCGTAIIMKQSPASVDKIIEFFKLSNGTREFLLQAKKGEALLYMEGKVSAIAIEILDKEKEMLKV